LLGEKNSQLEDTKAQLAGFSNENSKAVLPIHISPITNGLKDSHYSNREAQTLRDQNLDLLSEISGLRSELDALMIHALKHENDNLKKGPILDDYQKMNCKLKNSQGQAKAQIHSLLATVDQLQEENIILRTENRDIVDALSHQREMIYQIDQDVRLTMGGPQGVNCQRTPEKGFQIQFESHKSYSEYITKKIKISNTADCRTTNYFDANFVGNLRGYLKNLKSANLKLQNDQQWFMRELESKDLTISGQQAQNSDLKKNLEILGQRLESSEYLISELRENNDHLKRNMKYSLSTTDFDGTEAAKGQRLLNEKHEAIQKMGFDMKVVGIELAALKKSYDDLKKINLSLTLENQKLSTRLDSERKIGDCLRDDKINFNFDSKILNDEIESLLKTVQDCKKANSDLRKVNSGLRVRLDERKSIDFELDSRISQNSSERRSIFSLDNYLGDLRTEMEFGGPRKLEVIEQDTPNGGKDFIIHEESSLSN
jgi:regulator of replication initiation timing